MSFTTDLPDVSGTWSCKVKHESSNGNVYYDTYSVTLKDDGTISLSKDEWFMYSSWSRSATGLTVNWGVSVGNGTSWNDSGTTLSIKFDDPSNPTSGKGTESRWVANSVVGGFTPNNYELEMSR